MSIHQLVNKAAVLHDALWFFIRWMNWDLLFCVCLSVCVCVCVCVCAQYAHTCIHTVFHKCEIYCIILQLVKELEQQCPPTGYQYSKWWWSVRMNEMLWLEMLPHTLFYSFGPAIQWPAKANMQQLKKTRRIDKRQTNLENINLSTTVQHSGNALQIHTIQPNTLMCYKSLKKM